MGKLISAAGEMAVKIDHINRENGNLVMVGKLGAWDAGDTKEMPMWVGIDHIDMEFQMHFSPQDVRNLIRLILGKPSILFSTLFSLVGFGKKSSQNSEVSK
jgi:hypothetical protein